MADPSYFYLEHCGQLIELPAGKILVGRDPACGIRFNDPAVSRRHLLVTVQEQSVQVQDLGSCNGTLINGESLTGQRELRHDDALQFGGRVLKLTRLQEGEGEGHTPTPGWPAVTRVRPKARLASERDLAGLRTVSHNCPRCRSKVGIESEVCAECGYQWPAGRTRLPTLKIKASLVNERRSGFRTAVDVPLIYAGQGLTFEATAKDLSRGGVFVQTELLEPVGTLCQVSFLPDAHPAVTAQGTVCHVVAAADGADPRPPGMGIRFDVLSEAGQRWIDSALGNQTA